MYNIDGDVMYITKDMYINEININKSRFIGIITKIYSQDEFDTIMNNVKELYPKATHYTYAYRLIDYYKVSDDGEPSSTAGLPILNIIESEDLYNTIIIVVRYFGGIKLGVGGLIRAYSTTAKECIKDKNILINSSIITINIDYTNIKELDNILNKVNCKIIDKSFDKDITYKINIDNNQLDLVNKFNYLKEKDTYLEL